MIGIEIEVPVVELIPLAAWAVQPGSEREVEGGLLDPAAGGAFSPDRIEQRFSGVTELQLRPLRQVEQLLQSGPGIGLRDQLGLRLAGSCWSSAPQRLRLRLRCFSWGSGLVSAGVAAGSMAVSPLTTTLTTRPPWRITRCKASFMRLKGTRVV